MGGKTSTTSSTVDVPPQVLAQYQAVNDAANQTASTPFQTYGGEFVAPVNQTQAAGIAGTSAAANEAQPYYGAATGVLGAAQAGVNPINQYAENSTAASSAPLSGADINRYLSPYLGDVMGSTAAVLNQNNQQQQAGQLGDAIKSGAFGGDRTGIAAANLEEQQNLANAQIYSGIANTGYQSALSTAQGQQQIGLAGANQLATIGQTAYGEGANTATTLAGLGAGAQTAALTGANAQIAAGTVEQQTSQAQDTAEYNQFLQEQSYPFQVDQFLANIAEGTGSLSGSATITQQPGGFFSDRRLKRDIQKIGKTYDGQDIVSYKMGDDERTHIGLIAQDVEKKHPQAVGVAGGFKTVDYGKATEKAANQGHFCAGGVVPIRRHRDAGGGVYDLTDVLNAQRQMYGNTGGNQQRNINQAGSSGGHSLAVSNAPPTAPPQSGMSQVGQGIQLANNAHKLYKSFNTPSSTPSAPATATPAGGITPTVAAAPDYSTMAPAGVQASGATTAAAPEATATAAPAADAAASGVASGAASGAAADAAGSAAAGAGGTALAAGGADAATAAAADAAAAAAAEYLAADAAVAVAAAKRGGAIRPKFDLGGSPYTQPGEDAQGNLNIPDQQNTNTLKAAPAAGKQPTGLQSLMYMSNPNNGSTLTGDMFSNQALATGGVAGRRGYGAGGPSDGGDIDPMDPESAAPVDTPAPPDPPDAAPATGVAAPQKSAPATSQTSWWDRNKGWVLPVVQGIGAMGTAKTVHPGVALAAGLEAGAESYVPTQEGLATAAKTQADAEQAQTMADVKKHFAQKLLNQQGQPTTSGVAPGQPYQPAAAATPATGLASGQNSQQQPSKAPDIAASLDNEARSRFSVNPALNAQEQADLNEANQGQALGFYNGNSAAQQVLARHDARVTSEQFQSKMNAQHEADALYAQATDPNADYQTRMAAGAKYNAWHQFTGDTYSVVAGNKTIDRTGAVAIGTAAPQPTLEQRAAYMADAIKPVDVPNSDGSVTQKQNWQRVGAPSPQAYADMLASYSTAGLPQPAPRSGDGTSPAAGGTSAPKTPRTPQTSTPAATGAPTQPSADDPYLSRSLADTSWRVQMPPVVSGTSQSPTALNQKNIYQNSAKKLSDDADEVTSNAATANTYLKAAKAIMDSKGSNVGYYAPVLAKASQLLGGGPASTDYQDLAKFLGNAAAQSAKATFPSATQQEMGIQFEQLSPYPGMDRDAINAMIAANMKNMRYNIDTAYRVKSYLGNGDLPANRPMDFNKWNQKYYPREKEVNAFAVANTPDGKRLYQYKKNGPWTE